MEQRERDGLRESITQTLRAYGRPMKSSELPGIRGSMPRAGVIAWMNIKGEVKKTEGGYTLP